MTKAICGLFVVFAVLTGCGSKESTPGTPAEESSGQTQASQVPTLAEALDEARASKKYVVALVTQGGEKGGLGSVFEKVKKIMPERVVFTEIDLGSTAEKELAARYEVADRPKPLILIITCRGDATSWLPADTKVGDVTLRLTSDIVPELARSIEEMPLVMLLVGPSGSEATKKARDAANSYGASSSEKFKLFVVDNADEREAFLVRGAGLSSKSQKPAVVVYHNKKYKGRLTGELTAGKIKELVHGPGCPCCK
jgi:hypothetical protein